ncbi:MAG: translation initiation factor IF-2 [Lachnospiraceae bacterium]|nr:translation initiation factor IF-2 [Lachnospiraceae bacterium]MDY2957210.1 translation initiation factor IF-2 [Lachnospiraceae bacterium]
MRVHEIAKELNIPSKEICAYLSTESKNFTNFSGLTDDEVKRVRSKFGSASKSQTNENNENVKKDNKKTDSNNSKQRNNKTEMNISEDREKKYRNNADNKHREKVSGTDRSNNADGKNVSGEKKNGYNHNNKKFGTRPDNRNKPENRNGEGRDRDGQRDNRNNGDFRRNSGDKKFGDRNQNGKFDSNRNGIGKNNDRKPAPSDDLVSKNGKNVSRKHNNNNTKFSKDKEKNKGKNRENDIAALDIKPKKEKKEEVIKTIVLPDVVTVKELAEKLKLQPAALIKKLFLQGKVVTINDELDYDSAEEIAVEYNVLCEHEVKVDVIAELLKENDEDDESKLTPRPPVVAVMGHVDHGKTSLLDAIKNSHVTDKEAGGITQKIGAYQVKTQGGDLITFLDTPGHEAFTAMRMRGAEATDIAILVVAADDGVMPQTVEAINHAKAAGVEIIVAVNKIDKPTANIERVKQELMEYELIPEEWGGTTIFCPVSARTGEGIDDLLEMIMLTADVLELKANKKRMARGIVIEAELDKGRGVVASILVQKGTLHVGDSVAAGSSHGKIRAMINDKDKSVKEAGPSVPVEILGLNEVPNAGEIIMAFGNEKEARNFADTFISEEKKKMVDESKHRVTLDDLFDQIKAGTVKELNLIIKADVQGSVEAIKTSLEKLSNEEVAVKIIHSGVGNISESDVILASASNAIIIGFGVKLDNQAKATADNEDVDIRFYSVIYHAINDIEAALHGMLEPIFEKQEIGRAEIRQIFKASGVGNIAGSIVTEGKLKAKALCTILRDGKVIYDGKIASLKRFKDEVKEVKGGYECGLVFEEFGDIQEGDIVVASEMVEIPR